MYLDTMPCDTHKYLCIYTYLFYEWESVHTIILTTNSTIMIKSNNPYVEALNFIASVLMPKFQNAANEPTKDKQIQKCRKWAHTKTHHRWLNTRGLTYVYIYISVYIHTCIYIYVYVCIYKYIYMNIGKWIQSYVYICIYIYMCICIYVYMYMYMCIYVYIYICVYVYVCIYVCVYINISPTSFPKSQVHDRDLNNIL